MKLITVKAFANNADDDAEVIFVVVAPDAETALHLVVEHAGTEAPWNRYEPGKVVEGSFDPPARVLGHCGAGAWTWG